MSNKPKLILINGQGGQGKDSFIDFIDAILRDKAGDHFPKVTNITTAWTGKKIAKDYLGWDGRSKTLEDRKLLSDVIDFLWTIDQPAKEIAKTLEWMARERPGCYLSDPYQVMVSDSPVVFIHCREPKFLKRLTDSFKDEYDIKALLITRGERKEYGNHADDNVFNYDYDYEVNAPEDGLHILKEKAEEFYNNVIAK